MHPGTNYLGHFALTGLLLPSLLARAGGRVVSVSSIAARGKIDFEDLPADRRYQWFASHARSKLANLLFALELDHRAKDGKAAWPATPAPPPAHFSLARSETGAAGHGSAKSSWPASRHWPGSRPGAARTTLYAATGAGLTGGEYIGPGGRAHLRGRRRQ